MAMHDDYDKKVLKQLTRIADSLKDIHFQLRSMNAGEDKICPNTSEDIIEAKREELELQERCKTCYYHNDLLGCCVEQINGHPCFNFASYFPKEVLL